MFSLSHRQSEYPQIPPALTALPYGNGRSYGDSCSECRRRTDTDPVA